MLKKDMDVLFSRKSDEWTTPQWLFENLNVKYNFTLDPASDGTNNKCIKHYTIQNDGLTQSWKDEVVFINPPYSKVYDWVKKAHSEAKQNNATCVLLIPARTDTRWFHEYCMDNTVTKSITFIKGRLKFGTQKNPAPFPSMIVEFGTQNKTQVQPQIRTMNNK